MHFDFSMSRAFCSEIDYTVIKNMSFIKKH